MESVLKNYIYKVLFVLVLTFSSVYAKDVKQWRGNSRDGVYKESNILKKWSPEGPKLLWFAEGAGAGYSSPVIVGNRIYITGNGKGDMGKREIFSAYDRSGKKLWQVDYGKRWTKSYPDARTTPTVVGNFAYVVSGNGDVASIDLTKKKLAWSQDMKTRTGGVTGTWGTAESPLVVGNMVIYTPGGDKTTMVALNRKNGSLVWQTRSLGDKSAYVSPLLIDHKGKKQIVGVTSTYAFGVDPSAGKIVWKIDYTKSAGPGLEYRGKKGVARDINTNTPIYRERRLFITSGYNHGGVMLELDEALKGAKVIWVTNDLDVHHGGAVLLGNYLYGSNWISNRDGNWVCIDWKTGKKKYEKAWDGKGKGAIVSAGEMLFCYEEKKGTVGLAAATPEGFNLTGTFQIQKGSGFHWCHPVILDGVMYIRRGDVLMAYKVSK